MEALRQAALSYCERQTRQFYRSLDRHETTVIEAMVAEDCQWVRGGNTLVGPLQMRTALLARDTSVKTRHLVCNAVASEAGEGEIEVHFDLLYLSDADKAASPKVLSGTDRYRQADGRWSLVFKQASLQF
jgi:hypothetical protein